MPRCPPREQLELLLTDRLVDEVEHSLLAHVDACRQCQETLETLTAEVTPRPPMRHSAAAGDRPDAPFWSRLRALTFPGADDLRSGRRNGAGDAPPRLIGPYLILRELGRGGMGVVYLAEQPGLKRQVALKVILTGPHADPEELARFRQEGEAAARLQHPNIVQIHEVGEADGLAFLALEYVDGVSLQHYLAGRPLEPRSAAQMVQTLAQALDYAHQRGVIHRDVKPANILLGKQPKGDDPGQIDRWLVSAPKLTDFGLARRLDGTIRLTRTGTAAGTPSYMAPEQALGHGDAAGPTVDVYGLGATLYELLTGRPPFHAPTPLATMRQAAEQEPVSPRQLQPATPGDLETICLRCLAKDPGRRYARAGDLAADLGRFLDGKPILARPAGFVECAWRWCRRKPAVAALTLGVALVLIAGSTVASLLAFWALAEQDRANQSADQARETAEREREARGLAELRFDQAESAVGAYLDGIENIDRLKEADFLDLRKQLLASAIPFYEDFVRQKPGDTRLEAKRGAAFGRLAALRAQLGERDQALADFRRMQAVFQGLIDGGQNGPENLYKLAASRTGAGKLLLEYGQHAEAEQEYRQAVSLFHRLIEIQDSPDYRQRLATIHRNLGLVLHQLRRMEEAGVEYGKALEIAQPIADQNPDVGEFREALATIRHSRGTWLSAVGRKQEAGEEYRKAIALRQVLAAESPHVPAYRHSLAMSHNNLGVFLDEIRQPEAALVEHGLALALCKRLVADFPSIPGYRKSLAFSHNHYGITLRTLKRFEESEAEHRAAIALRTPLAELFPNVPEHRWQLAQSHNNLAIVLLDMGNLEAAEMEHRQALAIRRQLALDVPHVPMHHEHLAQSHNNLGLLLEKAGKKEEAKAEYQLLLKVRTEMARRFPAEHDYQSSLGLALDRLGRLAREAGNQDEARQLHAQAVEHHLQALQLAAEVAAYRQRLNASAADLATILLRQRDHHAAGELAGRIASARPVFARHAYLAAEVFSRCSSLAAQDKSLSPSERDSLARTHVDRGLEQLREAVRLGYRDAAALKTNRNLAALRSRPEFQQLLADLDKR